MTINDDEERLLFCLDHKCGHDQCPNVPHLDFALVPIERVVKLPRIVPHLWTGPDDVAHGFPPGCSYCGESDAAQYGKPCPQRSCNTWYDILGVPEDADENQITDAYRELAKEWSPERLKQPDDKVLDGGYSATHMRWLNAAYAVLNDPVRRKQHDAELLEQRQVNPEITSDELNDAEVEDEFVLPSLHSHAESRAWTRKGISFACKGRHSEALTCYEKGLVFDSLNFAAWANKGISLQVAGCQAQAMECFERAIEIDPRCLRAWERRANKLWETGQLADALESYDKALALNPMNYGFWSHKGAILTELGRFEEALVCFDSVIQISNGESGWGGKGETLHSLGRYEEALGCQGKRLEMIARSTTLTADGRAAALADVWNHKAAALYRMGCYDQSIQCCEKALQFDSRFEIAWYNKGNNFWKLGKHQQAVTCYDKAVELDPDHAGSWNNKGICLRRLGRLEEALRCHEKALGCHPPEVLGWYNKALIQEDLGRIGDAISSYEQFLSVAPMDAHHRVNLEHARARLSNLKPTIKRNITMKDERPDYWAEAPSVEEAVLGGIKGNFRRGMAAKNISTEGLSAIPEAWQAHFISERFKEVLTSMAGPPARGGEDLPDLAEGEVEVARLTLLNSVHGEVTSLRARRESGDSGIILSMIDEYGIEFQLPVHKVPAPLTAEEVLLIFRDAEPSPTDTSCQIAFNSCFYPDLDAVAVAMGIKTATE